MNETNVKQIIEEFMRKRANQLEEADAPTRKTIIDELNGIETVQDTMVRRENNLSIEVQKLEIEKDRNKAELELKEREFEAEQAHREAELELEERRFKSEKRSRVTNTILNALGGVAKFVGGAALTAYTAYLGCKLSEDGNLPMNPAIRNAIDKFEKRMEK